VRPGELILGDGPVPQAEGRRARISVTNSGRFDAYLTSHFPLVRASAALRVDRVGLEGARLALPAGASVAIPAGTTKELEITWD